MPTDSRAVGGDRFLADRSPGVCPEHPARRFGIGAENGAVRIYRARFANAVTGSTIGEHVRHCLDHVSALVCKRLGAAVVRRTPPWHVWRRNLRLRSSILPLSAGELATWPTVALDEPLSALWITADGQMVTSRSTVARELVFVMNHTIHHPGDHWRAAGDPWSPGAGRFGHARRHRRPLTQSRVHRNNRSGRRRTSPSL